MNFGEYDEGRRRGDSPPPPPEWGKEGTGESPPPRPPCSRRKVKGEEPGVDKERLLSVKGGLAEVRGEAVEVEVVEVLVVGVETEGDEEVAIEAEPAEERVED